MPAATRGFSRRELPNQVDSGSARRCNVSCIKCNRTVPLVREKGTVVILAFNVLVSIALFNQVVDGSTAMVVMTLTFPVAGWIADTWIGRYKVLRTAVHLLLLSSTLEILLHVAIMYYASSEILVALKTVFDCLAAAGMSCFVACFIQFTTDQMIGASSDQLSFAIHWLMWGSGMGILSNAVIHCVLHDEMAVLVSQSLSLLCLLIACFVLWYWNNSLMTVPQISNPIKHILQVLNYARKHKFPERRSAFTYWEEDYPSRIDLGKDKYGGPFTTEEVEDVKTTFQLIPVVLCAAVANIGSWVTWLNLAREEHYESITRSWKLDNILHNSNSFIFAVGIVLFPLYDFFPFPLLYRYTPTMLKRIASGILLVSTSYFLSAVLGMLQICSTADNKSCIVHSTVFNVSENGLWWIMIPAATTSTGYLLLIVTLPEFVVAQTPPQVKGLMGGIAICSFIICGIIGFKGIYSDVFISIFPHRPEQGLTKWFYGNVVFAVVIFIAFILFVFISKRYQLRKRDDVIPYHMFAEDYFENNYHREREYSKRVNFFGYATPIPKPMVNGKYR